MKLYTKLCKEKNQKPEFIKSNIKPNEIFDITKSIRQGEKEFQKKSKSGNFTQKSLYEVIFILIKSICINLTTLKSYEKDDEKAYISVLKLLNTLNKTKTSNEELTKEIEHFSEVDFRLQKRINELQSYEFGRQKESEVSYSTRVGKAILVAGENIKELELVLEATKGKGIDLATLGRIGERQRQRVRLNVSSDQLCFGQEAVNGHGIVLALPSVDAVLYSAAKGEEKGGAALPIDGIALPDQLLSVLAKGTKLSASAGDDGG